MPLSPREESSTRVRDAHRCLAHLNLTPSLCRIYLEGSGAMSAPIVYSTKMTPTVIGKPNKHMMDAILASKHFDPKKTVMVGDNLETDIQFGQNSGIETLLVMTGEFSAFHAVDC